MIQLDDSILNSFTAGEELLNLKSNSEAMDLLTSAIYESVKGQPHPDSKFEGTNIGWECGDYRIVGWLKDSTGGYCLKFRKDFSKVGFETDKMFNDFIPNPEVAKLLCKVTTYVDQQACAIESVVCKNYVNQTRFGTIEYLNKEFEEFAGTFCAKLSEGRSTPVQECFPLNLHPDNLIEYLKAHNVSTNNVHVVK